MNKLKETLLAIKSYNFKYTTCVLTKLLVDAQLMWLYAEVWVSRAYVDILAMGIRLTGM